MLLSEALPYAPSNDANLFAASDTQRKTLEYEGKARPIPHDDVLEIDRATSWPFLGRLLVLYLVRCFLFDSVSPSVLDD